MVSEHNGTDLDIMFKEFKSASSSATAADVFSDLDDVVCTSTMSKAKFIQFETELALHGVTLIRCPHKSALTWALMGFYMIIANALLLNLLIAMFSDTFTRINKDAALVWKFQRWDLLKTYHARSSL